VAKFERIIPILVYEDIPSAHDFLVRTAPQKRSFLRRIGETELR
jgi:hypothetical protein